MDIQKGGIEVNIERSIRDAQLPPGGERAPAGPSRPQ
jgi:hypothetical protein